jgi:CheY-like chemotaxis protein
LDDDDDISTLLTGFFRKHGHQVTVTANGAAMFQALEAQQADLVFLDVMLLGEDGFSLCRRLRTASKVPVIQLVAGFSGPSNLPGARQGAGFLAAVSDRLESSFLGRQNSWKLPWASNSHAFGVRIVRTICLATPFHWQPWAGIEARFVQDLQLHFATALPGLPLEGVADRQGWRLIHPLISLPIGARQTARC